MADSVFNKLTNLLTPSPDAYLAHVEQSKAAGTQPMTRQQFERYNQPQPITTIGARG